MALGVPQGFAQAFHDRMLGVVNLERLTQALVFGANTRRLVDADLLGDGQVQRKVQEGVHASGFGRELLFQRAFGLLEQGVLFRVLGDQVGGDGFRAGEDFARAVLAPGVAEEAADLS